MISEILYECRYQILRGLDEHPDCARRPELEALCEAIAELELDLEEERRHSRQPSVEEATP